ncbi:MAG TPA: hypothetical protein VF691_10600, partial [Cytophagaceae bacterium]
MTFRNVLTYLGLIMSVLLYTNTCAIAQWESVGGPNGGRVDLLTHFEGRLYCANKFGTGYFVADTSTMLWSPSTSL